MHYYFSSRKYLVVCLENRRKFGEKRFQKFETECSSHFNDPGHENRLVGIEQIIFYLNKFSHLFVSIG